jgi:hypothetical protein
MAFEVHNGRGFCNKAVRWLETRYFEGLVNGTLIKKIKIPHKEIQKGSGAKSFMTNGLPRYD